jgi:Flp pilus assembly protein TadG
MKRKRCRRSDHGSLAALAFVALVPLVAAIGGFAVDCMHVNDGKGELQRATDAAALGGALDLVNYAGTGAVTAQTVSNSNSEPVNVALQVGSMNAADGAQGVYTSAPISRTVTATIWNSANGIGGKLDTNNNRPDRCTVDATIQINSIFAKMFGNFSQTINTHSVAGQANKVNSLLTFFPILVSTTLGDAYGDGALGATPVKGQLINFNTRGNSAWFNGLPGAGGASTIQDIAMAMINHQPVPAGDEGPVISGNNYDYNHGTMDSTEAAIAAALQGAAAPGTVVYFPLSADPISGTGSPKGKITGFISVLVPPGPWTAAGGAMFDNVSTPHTLRITGTVLGPIIVNGTTNSSGGTPATGQDGVYTVHLIQ